MCVFCLCIKLNFQCSRHRGVTPRLLLDHAKGHSEFIQLYVGCWSFRQRRHRQWAWMWSASFSYALMSVEIVVPWPWGRSGLMELPDMTGMNKVISMKIRNKSKKYYQSSIQNHLGVLYEIIFGVTNHKIAISTTGFWGSMLSACLVLDASEDPDFQCQLLILQGSVSHFPSSWALKARIPLK